MNETDEQYLNGQLAENDYEGGQEFDKVNALGLNWVCGLNYRIVNGVHNLTNDSKKEIFYAAGHTGVLYDFENNTQRLLQGHCNKITCTAVCALEEGDIVVTADSGNDSMLVVWDAREGIPRKTIFDPHPNGVETLDITPDGRYIVTVSKEKSEDIPQTVTLWDWRNPDRASVTSTKVLPKTKHLSYVLFNPSDPREFVTTGKKRVAFWSWENLERGFEYYGPELKDKKIEFTQTVFIPNSSQTVTGTTDGHIIVWDISLIMEDYSVPEERRKIKMVNLMNTGAKSDPNSKAKAHSINILKIQGDYLVVGASNGSVRFYDFKYTIVAWYEDIGIGNITSISFSRETSLARDSIKNRDDDRSTRSEDAETPFDCPNFIVVDNDCTIHMLKSNQFEEIEESRKKPVTLMKLLDSKIKALAVRPTGFMIALSCENGHLYEWNYNEKKMFLEPKKIFEDKAKPTCLDFSPDGRFLSVATANGQMWFYDYQKGEKGDWQPQSQSTNVSISQEHSSRRVLLQAFSSDSKYLAVADDFYCVTLFKNDHKFGDPTQPKEWFYNGKVKAQLGEITSLNFGKSMNENGEVRLRLFSIGKDKTLIEYDVHGSNQEGLKIVSKFQIEQEHNPTACIWYPVQNYREDILMTVNEEYKIKLWNVENTDEKFTKKTCLGPTYGGPINKFLVINEDDAGDKYLAYSTAKKIVGIIKLPIDGNPNHSMGLISHPDDITGIGVSKDGRYLFTAGGDDYSVNIWAIDLSVIHQNIVLQGEQNIFPDLLEGGREGQTYRDLKDFFYYSQIRSNNEDTTKARKLDDKVPLDELPDLMRALGYYPTNKEILNMQNEIRHSTVLETGEPQEYCDTDTFVRLFVNHRPVWGISKENIKEAFEVIAADFNKDNKDPRGGTLNFGDLIEILKTEGERMSHDEIYKCLDVLLGEGAADTIQDIDSDTLAKDILGFEEINEEGEDAANNTTN